MHADPFILRFIIIIIINKFLNHDLIIYFRFRPCVATVDAALLLLLSVVGKLAGFSDDYVNLLKMSITVLLFALAKLTPFVTQSKSKITETYGKCESALMAWIANISVIGGLFFGGFVNYWRRPGLKYAPLELKVRTCTS